ncbi:protein TRANSPARENT TESTA 9-like isoform X2 [Aristolochia californica]|uniref:protein TRANSPARENT TESTA 9-like isoform X2 n=1 Tax=Aristolochia californica TaxID=171875 RepID=UPI0035DF88D6
MWFPFWRSKNRFSLEQLRYLTDLLQQVTVVNDVNKGSVIEALRSIAELVTYGDQHDPAFFEFFMEKQIMGDFLRILKVSKTVTVALQLLQTMSIMIQNLRSDHAIYYIFSNEHINYLITYSFDFRNEELLSYYISFLRSISGKLNKNTISLLVKTQNDEIVSFPLYVEAIRFAFHDENMVRIAVRALTLNVYHVGDECVNRYFTSTALADYFSNLVVHFRKQCLNLDGLVSKARKKASPVDAATIYSAVDEIEDALYYFSDVISSGVPNLGRLITDNLLQLLIFPLLLPALKIDSSDETQIVPSTSLYLLCCILRIVKIKDLASCIAAALFCPVEVFLPTSNSKPNGFVSGNGFPHENKWEDHDTAMQADKASSSVIIPNSSTSQIHPEVFFPKHDQCANHFALRDVLLSYIVSGDCVQVLGSLSILATLLQTKELDESMLDALGILPERKQHKKLLLQALVGEGSGEEQLFSPENSLMKDGISGELDGYLQKLYDQYGLLKLCERPGTSPRVHRYQVFDALISLFCRSDISAETLWDGGWLLRQLLPYSEGGFNSRHLKLLKDSYLKCSSALLRETKGIWCDFLITVLDDEWKKCKKAFDAFSPKNDPKSILLQSGPHQVEGESSFAAGERMHEIVKVFVLCHQLQALASGATLPDQPPITISIDNPVTSRAKRAGLEGSVPKPGTEVIIVDAIPCRIAFERGKERHFCFLATSWGNSGWIFLVEELPLKQSHGVVRVAATLAGSNPRIDDKHSKWLHLRIRPSSLPFLEPTQSDSRRLKSNSLIDGRWTLAFKDEQSCKAAESMVLEELQLQSTEVERRLNHLLDLDGPVPSLQGSCPYLEAPSAT